MGFLSQLFRAATGLGNAAVAKDANSTNELTAIQLGTVYGPTALSKNGWYMLTWYDGDEQGHGGSRQAGKGHYTLRDKGRVVVEGRLERPNDGRVANNGTFILSDWHFFTGELQGTFFAFRADGSTILRRKYKANLYNSGIADNGRYAICQTCNSPNEHDGSVLTVFDLEAKTEIARWQPESGWAKNYSFSDDSSCVLLSYSDGPSLRYTLTGEFLDRTLWIDSGIDRGDLNIVARVLKEVNSRPKGEFASRLITGLDKTIQAARKNKDWRLPLGLKLKANCLDGLGDFRNALICYEEAMAMDPKIGVKRRADQLRKKLTGD